MKKPQLNILYEDNHLIVVEKPPGVLTQGGSLDLPVLLTDVKTYLKVKYRKPGDAFLGLVHRLDTNVGGVICFAKTSKGASRLSKDIKAQKFKKRYLAIVEGMIHHNDEVVLKDFIHKDEINKKALITRPGLGKESILKFKKLAQMDNFYLLEIKLITGRFHQIRAQLANYGTPIYGDQKYGSRKKSNELALYAHYLSFNHPTKKLELTFNHLPTSELFIPFLKMAGLIKKA